jgi:hypothetical protein
VSAVVPHTPATDFRLALMAALEPRLGMPVIAGRVDGAIKQRAVCSVWPIRRARASDHQLEEDVTLGVRCWLKWRDQKDPDRPVDPTPIEELSETLLAALSAVQTSLGPWYIDVVNVEFDAEAQGIEATVVGRQWNPFAMTEAGG